MDNYNEISTKFYNIEQLFKNIRNTKDTIEGTQKLLDDIMHQKTVYKLDIFMGIGEVKTITDCKDLWKQIQQYVVEDLQNKLEKAKQQYKELCKQYKEALNE